MSRSALSLSGLLLLLFAVSQFSNASPQRPDILEYEDGSIDAVHYFDLAPKKKEDIKKWLKNKTLETQTIGWNYHNSANTDGFAYTLLFKNNRIYLTGVTIESPEPGGTQVPFYDFFERYEKVLASWYTGALHIYKGRPLGYTHIRSSVTILHIKEGVLIKKEEKELKPATPKITP